MSTEMLSHPVADLFPMLPDDELAELAADIKERGQLQPIVLDVEGRILDGRNRYAACQMAEVEPAFETYDGDDPDGYALTVNIARRHLSAGARYIIAAQAARLNGGSNKFVTAASEADLLKQRVSDANVVLDWAPDLAPLIVAGAHPISKALETARQRKREAEALQAKMDRLHADADDLRILVEEERMSIDDAIAALNAREEKARQEAEDEAERLRLEEEERASEEARLEHERSVVRAREIEAARSASDNFVARVQSDTAAIIAGIQHGEQRLADKRMIEQIREALDLLERML